MTPGCLTCGYAVDSLRSCYSSTWRLFKDHPEILTPGYYYFNDNAPFYPGLHNVGSRVWTKDDFQDPPLGETSGPQKWRNGSAPVGIPPAVTVGDGACIRDGDSYPLPVIQRSLPGGIDSRCWTAAGQVAPDPSPALWLRNTALVPITPGQAILTWPDSSVFGRDASGLNLGASPLVHTTAGFLMAWTSFTQNHVLAAPQLPLPGDFAIYIVGYVPTLPKAPSACCIGTVVTVNNFAPLKITDSSLFSYYANTQIGVAAAGNYGALHIWSVRRVGTAYLFSRDGVLLGTVDQGQSSSLNIGVVADTLLQAGGNGNLAIAEVQVYDQPLSAAGNASITAALRASYGL